MRGKRELWRKRGRGRECLEKKNKLPGIKSLPYAYHYFVWFWQAQNNFPKLFKANVKQTPILHPPLLTSLPSPLWAKNSYRFSFLQPRVIIVLVMAFQAYPVPKIKLAKEGDLPPFLPTSLSLSDFPQIFQTVAKFVGEHWNTTTIY